MIRHILLLKPRNDTTPQQLETARQAIMGLVGRIPGLLNCHWGDNVAPADRRDGFELGFSMDFSDRASLDAYGPHPEHKAAAALVRAAVEHVLVFDLAL